MRKFVKLFAILASLSLANLASATLVHQYTFDGDTTDSIGGVNGVLQGNAAVENGQLVLRPGSDDYMTMDGAAIAINTFSSVSIEAWYTSDGTNAANYTMLAFFGETNPNTSWMGINYLFFQGTRQDGEYSRAALGTGNTNDPWMTESGANGAEFDDNTEHHAVVTVTATDITLYLDGQFASSTPLAAANQLSLVSTSLAMLGKSGYGDPLWNGSIDEFNIYDNVLSSADVAANFAAGTSVVPEPATMSVLSLGALALARRRRN